MSIISIVLFKNYQMEENIKGEIEICSKVNEVKNVFPRNILLSQIDAIRDTAKRAVFTEV